MIFEEGLNLAKFLNLAKLNNWCPLQVLKATGMPAVRLLDFILTLE